MSVNFSARGLHSVPCAKGLRVGKGGHVCGLIILCDIWGCYSLALILTTFGPDLLTVAFAFALALALLQW